MIERINKQELSSCWDGRPFGHNRHGPKSEGSCCAPFRGAAGSSSDTMSLGPRPTSVPSGILTHPAVWPQRTWAEIGPLIGVGVFQSNTMPPRLMPTSVPSGILIHAAVWPQQTWAENWGAGAVPPFGGGKLGPHLTQCRLGRGLPPYQVAS